MARPIKEGLNYFPLDIDFFDDPKIMMVEQDFGPKGGYIAVRLLCWVYKRGYCLKWDNKMALLLAKCVGDGVTGALVSEVVNALIREEFFDKGLFDQYAILTSGGIQNRWSHVMKLLKRKAVVKSEYSLVTEETIIDSEETKVNTEEIPPKKEESTQKESKGKESKEISSSSGEGEIKESFSMVLKRCKPVLLNLKAQQGGLPPEEIEIELGKFDKHHSETAFNDVDHMINAWGIWCKNYLKKKLKPIQNGKKINDTGEKPKIQKAKSASDYY